jgi:hypothetical protein
MSTNIGPYKEIRGADGRIRLVEDRKAKLKKLPVNKQIAARESAKNKVKFVRKNHGAG